MPEILFLEYPKCSTCQKARKWLEQHRLRFNARHIVDNPPSVAELEQWLNIGNRPLKSFFNTSGLKYKALQLKDKLPQMSREQQLQLLASDGMLVKRPLIIAGSVILTGFKEQEWKQLLQEESAL